MVIVQEQNFTNEGPRNELSSRGDDDKCECKSKELKENCEVTKSMFQEQTDSESKDNSEGPTEDEGLEMKTSCEDNLEQSNRRNEEASDCKSLRHGKESEGIEVEVAVRDNMSIKVKKTIENKIVAENSENWNDNNIAGTMDSDTRGNMVQVENSELSIEVAEERLEGQDDKLGEITEQKVEELDNNTDDEKEVTGYMIEHVIEVEDKSSKMRIDDKKLVESGGDMFKDLLHGNVSQFMKLDMAETSSVNIVMDNSNIGNNNQAIDIVGETVLDSEDVCEDEEIKESESCLSDSSMVGEDINYAKSVSLQEKHLDRRAINSHLKTDATSMFVFEVDDFFHEGIADVRSKVSKKMVDIFGMGKIEQEIFNISINVSLSKISGCLSSVKVQNIFVKSNCTRLGSSANKIKQIIDPALESDGLKEAIYLKETIEVIGLRDKTDIVDNQSTVNYIYSTAFVENKKKEKDIAEDELKSTKEESIRNVCINFVYVSGK